MITNPWVNRISALLLLCVIYAAGYSGGRDQVLILAQFAAYLPAIQNERL
jgi:hypothetical protein